MSKLVAISFENRQIRCVKAEVRGEVVTILQTRSLPDTELEAYLASEKSTSSFVVVGSFKELHQDTIFLPGIDEKHLPFVVSGEIRRNHPEISNYSFFFRVIGDSYQDGRIYKKISVFVYANDDLAPVVDRFIACDKRVIALYSSTAVLSGFLSASLEHAEETVIGITDLGWEKAIFVLEDGKLSFVRSFQSDAEGFTPEDVQNINMTIDYCFQSLRLKPARGYLLNSDADLTQPPAKVFIPMAPFEPSPLISGDKDAIRDYAVGLAALLSSAETRECSILSAEYATYFARKDFFRNGTLVLAACCVIACMAILFEVFELKSLDGDVVELRRSIAQQDKVQKSYDQVTAELGKHLNTLNYVTRSHAAVDAQRTLAELNAIRLAGVIMTNITLDTDDDGTMQVKITGTIAADRFEAKQQRFEELLRVLKGIQLFEVNAQHIEGKDGVFVVQARRKAA